MRSQESLNELRYLRRIQEDVEDQWRVRQPDLDRLHRLMALLYTSHGLVWKSHGCSGAGEHDPFAGEIVELALRIEASVQRGAHRAFNLFEQWRCEACSWNHNALYSLWATTAEPDPSSIRSTPSTPIASCTNAPTRGSTNPSPRPSTSATTPPASDSKPTPKSPPASPTGPPQASSATTSKSVTHRN